MSNSVNDKLETFFSDYRIRSYKKGQILLLEGQETHDIYYLIEGRVKQYDVTYRGDEAVLNVFKPISFFPMSLAMNKQESMYIFEAETDIQVRQAPVEKVLDFIKSNPDVLYDLLQRVYSGVDAILGRLTHLMSNSAKSRLLYELSVETRRFGEKRGDGSFVAIHEKELGARAGLSRETVSREINKLKADGLLELIKDGVIVRDVKELEKRAKEEI